MACLIVNSMSWTPHIFALTNPMFKLYTPEVVRLSETTRLGVSESLFKA